MEMEVADAEIDTEQAGVEMDTDIADVDMGTGLSDVEMNTEEEHGAAEEDAAQQVIAESPADSTTGDEGVATDVTASDVAAQQVIAESPQRGPEDDPGSSVIVSRTAGPKGRWIITGDGQTGIDLSFLPSHAGLGAKIKMPESGGR
jgi:hypothetical protein